MTTTGSDEPPQYPAGPLDLPAELDDRTRRDLIAEIEAFPARLKTAVAGLDETRLNTRYRNWTIRQIVHHLADSHTNGYVRWRLALTEDRPTIKPYDESRWAMLDDASRGPIEPSLAIVEALHRRWGRLLRSLAAEQFAREYDHPEMGRDVRLDESLGSYVWHGRHHLAQIVWVRRRYAWDTPSIDRP